ncbi:MAG: FadR/GntR family transcriptional regulator [Syntrophobacteraceae bacterium]
MFKPIKPKRISDQVFDQLKDLIFRGHLKPGEKLMTERDLAQSMGISRPTVREAINKLVAMGLLEHRQGQGTYVASPADSSDKNPLAVVMEGHDATLVELLEVRLGLECNAVSFAARRATEEDVQELESCLNQMESDISGGRLGSSADVAFHMAIAFATQNKVQIHIMRSFYNLLFYGIKENLERLYSDPGNLGKVIAQHAAIVDAIRRHDPDGAHEAMKQHIVFVMEFFQSQSAMAS